MIRALTFDFWDTLYSYDSGIEEQRRKLRVNRLLALPGFSGISREELLPKFEFARQEALARGIEPLSAAMAGHLLDAMDMPAGRELLETVTAIIREAAMEHPPTVIPGVQDVLAQLAERFPLGLISDIGFTNGSVLRKVMARDGLERYFSAFTFSDETGHRKPHPDQFTDTAARLGVKPEETLHVGDLVPTDIAGAAAVGAKAVLYIGRHEDQTDKDQADWVIRDHGEILRLIDESDASQDSDAAGG